MWCILNAPHRFSGFSHICPGSIIWWWHETVRCECVVWHDVFLSSEEPTACWDAAAASDVRQKIRRLCADGLAGDTDAGSLSLKCRPIKRAEWPRGSRVRPINHLKHVYFSLLITSNRVWFRKHDGWTVLVRVHQRCVGLWSGSGVVTGVGSVDRCDRFRSLSGKSLGGLLFLVSFTGCRLMSLTWSHKECRFQPELI